MKKLAQSASRMLNRFGLSALSKHNAEIALNEEIMVDKETGEFLIKSREGYTISFDALSRRKSLLDDVEHFNNIMNMDGNVYIIDLDHLHLPCNIPYDHQILDNPIVLKERDLNRLLFHFDIDEIIPNVVAEVSTEEPLVEIAIHATRPGDNDEVYCVHFNIEKPLSEINNKVIRIEDIVLEVPLNIYKVSLVGVKIKKNPNNTCPNSKVFLHNIAVTID